jgi:hypothetical protein
MLLNEEQLEKVKAQIVEKLLLSVEYYKGINKNPRTWDKKGEPVLVKPSDWTSGFYPGCLWLGYEMSGDEKLKKAAEEHTKILENQKNNSTTHDMGFKMCCSFGNGFRITHDPYYKKVLIQSAKTLISRYNPAVGCIRSWDHHKKQWEYPVIIDNMMNLELLFWAFNETNDSVFYKIAVSHADKTMKNHFRKDYSCYHVVDYDTLTGNVIKKNTHQGYADNSSWARGQAWALYGFTMVYRYTHDKKYLKQAEKIADFILNNRNMPEDMIPYWDFDDPAIPNAPRDVSAAAITSSALFELAHYSNDSTKYFKNAEVILSSLINHYQTPENSVKNNNYFLLDHSTGNLPAHSEVDVPIIYADYYFMEALLRRSNTDHFSCN